MALIRLKRGSRAQLQSAASAGELHEGEPYYVTDEERFAVGTGTSGYVEPVMPGDLAEVATSGSYDDLDDKPSIPSAPGDIGARPAGDVPWGDVSDKPSTFPPAPHTHSIGDVSGLRDELDGKQPAGDYLTEGDLPDLSPYAKTADLASVATSGSYDDLGDKPDIPSSPGDVGARPAGDVPWEEVSGKPSTFPPSSHTHSIGDVSGLQGALDGKQPTGDYLTENDLPDLSGYVETDDPRLSDARTPLAHTHSIGDVTGLQSALDSKAGTGDVFDGDYGSLDNIPSTFPPASHTHPAAQISDASTVGRSVLTAADAANARSAIGAVAYEGSTPLKLWTGTQAQYDNISSPDANTVYVVKE